MRKAMSRQQKIHKNSRDHGFWPELDDLRSPETQRQAVRSTIPTKLCLIHSEVSEALEEFRSDHALIWSGTGGKPEGLMAELADVVIRCYDLAGALGQDLDDAVELKMNYNAGRPYKHGGKKC